MKRRRSFKKGDKVWYQGELGEVMDIWVGKGVQREYYQYKVGWGSEALHTSSGDKWITVSSAWVTAKDLKRATMAEIVAETLKG